jgi:long-chain fatty acid transport protein
MYTRNQTGLGWNVGLLGKFGENFSAGISYRSKVKVDMEGQASFVQFRTGYADFDTIVTSLLPFKENPDVTTGIEFPFEARVALAWHGGAWSVEADVVRQGWSSFKDLPITFVKYPQLSSVRPENYQDSNTYRMGVEYKASENWAWQFGLLYDESPVPVGSVSPLLPDANRKGISIGFSKSFSAKTRLDVGFLHLIFDERSTEGMDGDNFNGTYQNRAELLGFTLVHRF